MKIIDDKYTEFSISLDFDEDESLKYPVFLFIPNKKRHEHDHIKLNLDQAKKLRDWLTDYVGDMNPGKTSLIEIENSILRERLFKAEEIIEEMALPPYKDSDINSLYNILNSRAKHYLEIAQSKTIP